MSATNHPGLTARGTRHVLLLCLYVLVAAAAFCGMYAKHSFGDGDRYTSLTAILDGDAARPYVYRQLLPSLANLADKTLPAALRERFVAHLEQDAPAHNPLRATFARATSTDDTIHALRYYIVYALSFCSLVAALLMLRGVAFDLTGDEAAATLAPLALAIVVPASYYYDFPELLCMTLGVWLACRAKLAWLVALTLVATLNKESFAVFVVTLYPFLRLRASRRAAIVGIGMCIVAGALANLFIKHVYAHNTGSPAMFNFWFNLQFYADPRNYFRSEWTYGIPLPRGTNVIVLALLALLVRAGWPGLPRCAKQHALLAAALNVPLFLTLGFVDEVRALSMLDVSAMLLLCTSATAWLARERQAAPASAIEPPSSSRPGDALNGQPAAVARDAQTRHASLRRPVCAP